MQCGRGASSLAAKGTGQRATPPISWVGGWAYCIPATAKQKQSAWELIRFLTSKRAHEILLLSEKYTHLADGRPFIPRQFPHRQINEWAYENYVLKNETLEPKFKAVRIKIAMVIQRNTPLGAWWAKCKRSYTKTFNYISFWRYACTSAFLVILNVIGNIFSCSLVAFAFARLQWPGRNLGFGLMLAGMMTPPQVTMIPYFLIIKYFGWFNTLKPLWVISFFGNAFNIFLLRQFMKGIPRDLEDAARIDGCNFWHIYWYVIMPLIKPTLACIAIFTFMAVWNDFMGPLIYLSDQRQYPLSLGLYALQVIEEKDFGMMLAGSLLMTLPVIAIFFFAQRYFIQGITLTGVKG